MATKSKSKPKTKSDEFKQYICFDTTFDGDGILIDVNKVSIVEDLSSTKDHEYYIEVSFPVRKEPDHGNKLAAIKIK